MRTSLRSGLDLIFYWTQRHPERSGRSARSFSCAYSALECLSPQTQFLSRGIGLMLCQRVYHALGNKRFSTFLAMRSIKRVFLFAFRAYDTTIYHNTPITHRSTTTPILVPTTNQYHAIKALPLQGGKPTRAANILNTGYYSLVMPSWNIHTAHVERLLTERTADELGIADANAFLFGNYVPDIYLGFMVHDTTYRIDYCLTHMAEPDVTPAPDADRFWDECVWHQIRRPDSPSTMSLTLGAWAHLIADRTYNLRFRAFCETHDTPTGDELRRSKQADFDLFGRSLKASACAKETPELFDAAQQFRPYSVLPADVHRAIEVATTIAHESGSSPHDGGYQILTFDWMTKAFNACHQHLSAWLLTWQRLEHEGRPYSATDIRETHDGNLPRE